MTVSGIASALIIHLQPSLRSKRVPGYSTTSLHLRMLADSPCVLQDSVNAAVSEQETNKMGLFQCRWSGWWRVSESESYTYSVRACARQQGRPAQRQCSGWLAGCACTHCIGLVQSIHTHTPWLHYQHWWRPALCRLHLLYLITNRPPHKLSQYHHSHKMLD